MTPYEQEKQDKSNTVVPVHEIEKRIASVEYQREDYDNVVTCVITVDNGFKAWGTERATERNLDIAETTAYARAFEVLRTAFDFLRAEQLYWLAAQQRDLGMMVAFGTQDGD